MTKGVKTVSENGSEFQPNFERLAKMIGGLLKIAYDGMETLERNIFDILDKQMVNRLLSQYDQLVKAGFTRQEALDVVTNFIRRRLETAIQERSQS